MKCLTILLSIVALVAGARVASEQEVKRAAFSIFEPTELQFSDGVGYDTREEGYAKTLVQDDSDGRLAAAQALWEGHSRRHASKVLKYMADPPPGGEDYRAFQRKIDAAFQPDAILRELQEGDYEWGAWLAFLRPHKDLVPTLLAGLKDKPKMLPETMLALGNSGDPRALEPLLELLKSKDYRTAGDAAQALGYLGGKDVEVKLIEALAEDNGWRQVKACGALAKLGSRRALPALEKLANSDRYTGALSIKGMAKTAVERIKKREKL
jgi:hypothetical protein